MNLLTSVPGISLPWETLPEAAAPETLKTSSWTQYRLNFSTWLDSAPQTDLSTHTGTVNIQECFSVQSWVKLTTGFCWCLIDPTQDFNVYVTVCHCKETNLVQKRLKTQRGKTVKEIRRVWEERQSLDDCGDFSVTSVWSVSLQWFHATFWYHLSSPGTSAEQTSQVPGSIHRLCLMENQNRSEHLSRVEEAPCSGKTLLEFRNRVQTWGGSLFTLNQLFY